MCVRALVYSPVVGLQSKMAASNSDSNKYMYFSYLAIMKSMMAVIAE